MKLIIEYKSSVEPSVVDLDTMLQPHFYLGGWELSNVSRLFIAKTEEEAQRILRILSNL